MCGEWAQVIQDVINEHHGTGKLDTLGPWNDGQTRAGPMDESVQPGHLRTLRHRLVRLRRLRSLGKAGSWTQLDHNNVKIGVPNPIPIFETSARVTVVHLERLSQPHLSGY